ncbi:twin-arginine translocase TatA/TatE family subunit [Hymenobacter oligotrophus]|uniref:Sec-independent protein translocase protein TatA n=1 Tax=Hymenobacter oligotrophus TaxID=2319843 RepID=A0A3B7R2E3_9BACT|nr:twin-arginine translocase TatA/TatE family subunit [Hymenobacter oligotrophus]AYA37490.1 twin-arginine translocase TatA/TatE family subunit [Hymenobacter oligotrophus]
MSTPFLLFLGDIGGSEMLLIMVVILIFFGANKIPELARGLGKGIREFKDASREIRSEIENANTQPNGYQQPASQPQPYQQAPPAPVAYQSSGLDQPQSGPVPAPEQPTVTPAGLPHPPSDQHPIT